MLWRHAIKRSGQYSWQDWVASLPHCRSSVLWSPGGRLLPQFPTSCVNGDWDAAAAGRSVGDRGAHRLQEGDGGVDVCVAGLERLHSAAAYGGSSPASCQLYRT